MQDALLEPAGDLLRRYRRAAATLQRLIAALESAQGTDPDEPEGERRPPVAHIEARTGDIEAVLAFQERLANIEGVTRVTIAGSSGERASFIVELQPDDDSPGRVECSMCGKVIQEGGLPVSHGLCEDCRSEFGAPPAFRLP